MVIARRRRLSLPFPAGIISDSRPTEGDHAVSIDERSLCLTVRNATAVMLVYKGQILVYDVETSVAAQTFGDYDALGCLVVFEKGRHDARQGEGRAI